jgi:hypothetical protein
MDSAVHYKRHRPQRTPLYRLVEEYYPAFASQLAEQGTELPEYVQREFEDYLTYPRREHGFLRGRYQAAPIREALVADRAR